MKPFGNVSLHQPCRLYLILLRRLSMFSGFEYIIYVYISTHNNKRNLITLPHFLFIYWQRRCHCFFFPLFLPHHQVNISKVPVYIKWLTVVEDVLVAVVGFRRRRLLLTRRRFQMMARTCEKEKNKELQSIRHLLGKWVFAKLHSTPTRHVKSNFFFFI